MMKSMQNKAMHKFLRCIRDSPCEAMRVLLNLLSSLVVLLVDFMLLICLAQSSSQLACLAQSDMSSSELASLAQSGMSSSA